jgi:hypothetical protein
MTTRRHRSKRKTMKTICIVIAFVFLTTATASAQLALGAAGVSTSSNTIQISWTIGDVIIGAVESGQKHIVLGFQQPSFEIVTNVAAADENNISVYPNPFDKSIIVSDPAAIQLKYIQVFDISGNLVFSKHTRSPEAEIEIETTSWNSGVYLMKVNETPSVFIKLIKQ